MKIVRSQDLHYSVPINRIARTTVEYKAEDHRYIVTATCDRPLVLGRYTSEEEAIAADTLMWLSEDPVYTFPAPGEKS
ncbi:MAG: hypothetical protein IKS55_02470 [Oscillospiraceae bacterium]|nr:hypothetical protein [Oscillospiraceae bacterium]